MAVSRIPPPSSPQMTTSGQVVSGDTAISYTRTPSEDSVYTGRIAIPRNASPTLSPTVPVSSPAAIQTAPIVPVVTPESTVISAPLYSDAGRWAASAASGSSMWSTLPLLPAAQTAAGSGDTSADTPAPAAQTASGATIGSRPASGFNPGLLLVLALAGLVLWRR